MSDLNLKNRYASFCFTSTVNYFKVVSILRKKPSNLCSFQWSYLLDFYEWHLNVESHRIILTLILSFFILHSITQKSHKKRTFSKAPEKNRNGKLFQLKKPEKSASSVRKFLKEAIDLVITKSMFEDARNFTNLLSVKIQLNAAYVQGKKNLQTKEHCTFILKKCTLTKNVKFVRTQF